MRVLVAQIGARRHYAVPRAFAENNCLDRLVTNLCAHHRLVQLANLLPKDLLPGGIRRLLERKVNDVAENRIVSMAMFDLLAMFDSLIMRGRPSQTQSNLYRGYVKKNSRFCKAVIHRGFGEADTLYGFNGAAVEIFQAARKKGIRCILDQTMAPISYTEAILQEERERFPGWEEETCNSDDWKSLAEREAKEWELADRIICGSEFVSHSVGKCGGPQDRCRVVGYGFPQREFQNRSDNSNRERSTFHILFPGTICLRKGIQYVWEAARRLQSKNILFRAVGPLQLSEKGLKQIRPEIELVGAVPRSEMRSHYEWADLVILPSLAEGSANVTYEALVAGKPVLTTFNAGSPIVDGKNGWIVPIRDIERTIGIINNAACFPEQLERYAKAARNSVRQLQQETYGARLTEAVN